MNFTQSRFSGIRCRLAPSHLRVSLTSPLLPASSRVSKFLGCDVWCPLCRRVCSCVFEESVRMDRIHTTDELSWSMSLFHLERIFDERAPPPKKSPQQHHLHSSIGIRHGFAKYSDHSFYVICCCRFLFCSRGLPWRTFVRHGSFFRRTQLQ